MRTRPTPRRHRPVRVAEMTGVAPNLLRQWYARGHFDWNSSPDEGLDTFQAAEVAVRAWLSLIGCPPKRSNQIGRAAVPHLLYYAVLDVPASLQLHGSRADRREFLRRHAADEDLAADIVGMSGQQPFVSIIMLDDQSSPELSYYPPVEFAGEDCIAIRAINLSGLAFRFADAAQQPLIDIEL